MWGLAKFNVSYLLGLLLGGALVWSPRYHQDNIIDLAGGMIERYYVVYSTNSGGEVISVEIPWIEKAYTNSGYTFERITKEAGTWVTSSIPVYKVSDISVSARTYSADTNTFSSTYQGTFPRLSSLSYASTGGRYLMNAYSNVTFNGDALSLYSKAKRTHTGLTLGGVSVASFTADTYIYTNNSGGDGYLLEFGLVEGQPYSWTAWPSNYASLNVTQLVGYESINPPSAIYFENAAFTNQLTTSSFSYAGIGVSNYTPRGYPFYLADSWKSLGGGAVTISCSDLASNLVRTAPVYTNYDGNYARASGPTPWNIVIGSRLSQDLYTLVSYESESIIEEGNWLQPATNHDPSTEYMGVTYDHFDTDYSPFRLTLFDAFEYVGLPGGTTEYPDSTIIDYNYFVTGSNLFLRNKVLSACRNTLAPVTILLPPTNGNATTSFTTSDQGADMTAGFEVDDAWIWWLPTPPTGGIEQATWNAKIDSSRQAASGFSSTFFKKVEALHEAPISTNTILGTNYYCYGAPWNACYSEADGGGPNLILYAATIDALSGELSFSAAGIPADVAGNFSFLGHFNEETSDSDLYDDMGTGLPMTWNVSEYNEWHSIGNTNVPLAGDAATHYGYCVGDTNDITFSDLYALCPTDYPDNTTKDMEIIDTFPTFSASTLPEKYNVRVYYGRSLHSWDEAKSVAVQNLHHGEYESYSKASVAIGCMGSRGKAPGSPLQAWEARIIEATWDIYVTNLCTRSKKIVDFYSYYTTNTLIPGDFLFAGESFPTSVYTVTTELYRGANVVSSPTNTWARFNSVDIGLSNSVRNIQGYTKGEIDADPSWWPSEPGIGEVKTKGFYLSPTNLRAVVRWQFEYCTNSW